MSVNAREERFEHIELLSNPALFTNNRIDRTTVPEGFYCYDLRGSNDDPGRPVMLENSVSINHMGAILTAAPVKFQKDKEFRRINGKLNFLGEEITLAEFCQKHGLLRLRAGIEVLDDSKVYHLEQISPRTAEHIIDTRLPLGTFYVPPGKGSHVYIGIDNRTGDCWVEEFKHRMKCRKWLLGYEEA